jgi:hypothetical protein
MTKNTENVVIPKMPKKRGRPAIGRDPAIVVRLPSELIKKIEKWRMEYPAMSNRSAAIRCLIDRGLLENSSRPLIDPKDEDVRRWRKNGQRGWTVFQRAPKKPKKTAPAQAQPAPAGSPRLPGGARLIKLRHTPKCDPK